MKAVNQTRKMADQNPLTWAGILGVAALLLTSIGLLIYFFVVPN